MINMVVDLPEWLERAECRRVDAPPMFEDAWGIGREGHMKRITALKCCLRCPVRLQCGESALEAYDDGQAIYGMVAGIEFTDVTPCRQEPLVERLRSAVITLSQQVQ